MQLTKDCQLVLSVLYREYLTRRNHRVPLSDACYFGNGNSIQENFLPDMLPEDVNELCWMLHEKELLHVTPGDDLANNVTLTQDGIIYMEHQTPDKLKNIGDVITWLSGIISTIISFYK